VLKTAFQNYVNEACPHLSPQERAKLVANLYRMTIRWSTQPAGKRQSFLESAVALISQKTGAQPVAYGVELLCSNRGRAAEEIKKQAEAYLHGWEKKIGQLRSSSPRKKSAVKLSKIDPLEQREKFTIIRFRVKGALLSERELRRATATVQGKRSLKIAATRYSQIPLFQ